MRDARTAEMLMSCRHQDRVHCCFAGGATSSASRVGADVMNSREVLKRLKADGWYEVRQKGDHLQLKHPHKAGLVTVIHPAPDFAIKTLISMERQSGVNLRGR
jgi:predicted RNA binding protein YcfA (HicA-like mRNA interferase family)